jgi:hypothetical protein
MSIHPVVLSSLTAAVSVLGTDYLKGVGSEAGKATWTGIKTLDDPRILSRLKSQRK